jgi:hypothetical protein
MARDGIGKRRGRLSDCAVAIVVGLTPFGIGVAAHFGELKLVGVLVIVGAIAALLAVLLIRRAR